MGMSLNNINNMNNPIQKNMNINSFNNLNPNQNKYDEGHLPHEKVWSIMILIKIQWLIKYIWSVVIENNSMNFNNQNNIFNYYYANNSMGNFSNMNMGMNMNYDINNMGLICLE